MKNLTKIFILIVFGVFITSTVYGAPFLMPSQIGTGTAKKGYVLMSTGPRSMPSWKEMPSLPSASSASSDLSEYVPYTGATTAVNLGIQNLFTTGSGTFGSLLANGYITQYNSSNTVTFSIKHDQTHFSDTLTEISAFANDGSPKMITMLGGLIVKDGDAVQPAYLYLSDYGESYKSWLTQESGTLTYHSATGTHSFGYDDITTHGNIYNRIDNSKHYFGTGMDAYLTFDGDSLNIIANAHNGSDNLELEASKVKIKNDLLVVGSTDASKYKVEGTEPVADGTYNFDGAATGTVSSMTIKGGIITGITTR